MSMKLLVLLIIALAAVALVYLHNRGKQKVLDAQAETNRVQNAFEYRLRVMSDEHQRLVVELREEIKSLVPYRGVRDAEQKASQVRDEAQQILAAAKASAEGIVAHAQGATESAINQAMTEAAAIRQRAMGDAQAKQLQIDSLMQKAALQAQDIIDSANKRGEEIAGDAYRALHDADRISRTATAMGNVINGYGDRYLKPTYSLLDELAETYSFDDAGAQLKLARAHTRKVSDRLEAASCDYVEPVRRDTAIRFVQDAFNGKVDSILSRVKSENFGTLEQQIRDSFALVNHHGAAFRNARITETYLNARLDELRHAVTVMALRDREREEQRRLREQIREEEKARREIERALKEAAKDEETLQRAMEKVQSQVAKANDVQRAVLEARLKQLEADLAEAEARGRRALSMAQQTKAGHVYVISNVGSFGDHVYKVGMTRRLEPLDRVRELGDASVPFGFDVHAMIWSEDAPRLETQLHKAFLRAQVNKVNPRKEFFRVALSELRGYLDQVGISASWTMSAAAAEYRESREIERRISENPAAAKDWLAHQIAEAEVLSEIPDVEEA